MVDKNRYRIWLAQSKALCKYEYVLVYEFGGSLEAIFTKEKIAQDPVAHIFDHPVMFSELFLTFSISFVCTSIAGDSHSKCLSNPPLPLHPQFSFPSWGSSDMGHCNSITAVLPVTCVSTEVRVTCDSEPCLHPLGLWPAAGAVGDVVVNRRLKSEWPGLEFHSMCYAEKIPEVSKAQIRFHNSLKRISEDLED